MDTNDSTTSTTPPTDAIITSLQGQVAELQARNGDLRNFISLINDTANEKYSKHGWCDEYLETLEELNAAAPFDISLRLPKRTFVVRVLISARVEAKVSVEVEAKDAEHATAIVNDMIEADEIVVDHVTYTSEELLTSFADLESDAQDIEIDAYRAYHHFG